MGSACVVAAAVVHVSVGGAGCLVARIFGGCACMRFPTLYLASSLFCNYFLGALRVYETQCNHNSESCLMWTAPALYSAR